MKRRTIEQLAAIDERVARIGPLGLMVDRRLTDEATVDHLQDQVLDLDLPETVPAAVREHFDALRDLHIHGAFQAKFFAIVVTQASLLMEHALGARFIEAHGGRVPLRQPKAKQSEVVEVDDFATLSERFAQRWHLEGDPTFNGSLKSLLRWAHEAALLRHWLSAIWEPRRKSIQTAELMTFGPDRRIPPGWSDWTPDERAAWWEDTFRPQWEHRYIENERQLRNLLAHRTSRYLTVAGDSAEALRTVAAIIASLWES